MDRREFIKITGLSALMTSFSNGLLKKSFAFANENTKNTDLSRVRFGLGENEVITFCKHGADSSTCIGVKCNMYSDCWRDLNPDKNGYFKSKVIHYNSS